MIVYHCNLSFITVIDDVVDIEGSITEKIIKIK